MSTRVLSPREQTHLARYSPIPVRVSPTDTRPVEHITGVAEFRDLALQVTKDALIPRIETEELVELALAEINKKLSIAIDFVSIAEVGTGSGAIAVSVLHKLVAEIDRIKFLATDISPHALAIAKRNAYQVLGLLPQLSFLQSDLLNKAKPTLQLDVIIANLPYIPSGKLKSLDPSVRDHEPHLALDGGDDGLKLISQLLKQAPDHLQPDGVVLLEVDESHTKEAMSEFLSDWNLEFITDQFKRNRFIRASLR
ncbi:MAG: peptide chain release factor N(5)-glutamine methyltransferase [Candidatus Pacebacteria bacterium CG_4_10_14_0_8_um_filter_42_14]|nr:MAG: peptide chain release factor N(5)-glutamine methyltransferase [Candidatus Pacebacteria bacterium CG_4_10_14_0_8_um_filter_42_14]